MIAVLGAGGHGHDIAAIAQARGVGVEFYDDGWNTLPCCCRNRGRYVVGVNDPATRRRLAVGSNAVTLVHPTATVSPDAKLSEGVVVGAASTVGPQVVLGPHVHIGPGCTVTRTTVGGYTTISPGVDIAGDVTIGEECMIGVGATISNLVTIGDRVTIGAGAVVLENVPADQTWAGVPAKQLR